MAEGGFENPVYDPDDLCSDDRDEDNGDGDQDSNETTPFWPGSASTPEPSGEEIPMQTMQHEKSGLPDTSFDEISSLEGFTHQDDKPAMLDRAKEFIKKKFPNVDFAKLGPIGFSKKSSNETTIVSFGSKGGETEIFRKDRGGLLKKFTDKFKTSLGPEAESLIAQDNEEIRETRQSLREAESQLKEAEKLSSEREKAFQEVQDLRTRLDQMQASIDALHDEQGSTLESESELRRLQQLRKNLKTDFDNAKKEVAALQKQAKNTPKERVTVDKLRKEISEKERERNTLEEGLNSTKTLDDLKEQEAELQKQDVQDRGIIRNEDTSPSEREAAEGRVEERPEELARLRTQIEERERALPLRERIKEILKKYGVTVTAIVLAAGVTIGAVIGAITKLNALKATGKALGKGLKDLGKKTASLLPGLLGSIVSFLFKPAGQAIGFLAEDTLLLILSVVAFLMETYIKKRH